MTIIKQDDLIQSVADALQFISYYHPVDFIRALTRAYEKEQSPAARDAIVQILVNSRMCAEGHRPICQDTGIVTVFLKVGMKLQWDATMSVEDMVNEGVRRAYQHEHNTLRASILADPAGARKNTKDNTPAVINMTIVPGDKLDVIVAAKGGGSEAKAKFAMLNPSDSVEEWVLKTVPTMGAGWCPPGILGIGIGGTAEKAMLLAKESLMDPIDIQELMERGAKTRAEELRIDLYKKVNALGIGAQGLGGLTTVLDVKVPRLPNPRGKPAGCHDSQLRGHATCALRARWLRRGRAQAPFARRLADAHLRPDGLRRASRKPRHRHTRRGGDVEAGRSSAAQRQVTHRPRCRAQAHDRHAQARREAAGGLQEPLHLLRRAGRSRARGNCRTSRTHHRHPHGQIHPSDAQSRRDCWAWLAKPSAARRPSRPFAITRRFI